jgi:microcin C transport system permease protein
MSAVLDNPALPAAAAAGLPRSPGQRAWARFRRNRLGTWSLWIFLVMLVLATAADLLSNDRPLLARIDGQWYAPMFSNPSEKALGGDFATPMDWKDPLAAELLARPGNWALTTLNPHSADSINYFSPVLHPGAPTAEHWLGTDGKGRDMVARLLYGFRVSVWFALALTLTGTLLGIAAGALQGYFGGRTDLFVQRFVEVWGAVPELYLLIIFASIFEPSLLLLLILLSLWGWMGLSNWQIIRRHVLPNSMTPVITFLPFRMSGGILALTSLDFLGLGAPASVASLGELLKQGKDHLDAWWIIVPTFVVLVLTMLLLTFIGDALRDAFDTRKS